MKRVLLLSSSENERSISPHVANALSLSDALGWDIVFDVGSQIEEALERRYDALIFVHGTGREKTQATIDNLHHMMRMYDCGWPELYYLKNDYDLGENNTL